MSESKHTPGPWRIAEDRDGEVVSGPQSNLIAQCFGSYAHNTVHQIDANCRLIAAAPDLYEALKRAPTIPVGLLSRDGELVRRVEQWFLDYQNWQFDIQVAALARAKGETEVAETFDTAPNGLRLHPPPCCRKDCCRDPLPPALSPRR